MDKTTEEIAQDYIAMGHSVSLITDIIAGDAMADDTAEDKQGAVDRNVEHLELMVAKDYWTDEDMTAVNSAITAGNGYTAQGENMTEQSNIIKIYDKEYDQSAFDANQKLIVSHIKVLQQKVTNLRFELDQASVAQDAFINKLVASLDKPVVEEKDVG